MPLKRFAFWLLCLTLLCLNVSAHSGRTDSRGGHHVSSDGSYHYHHEYPAHQHVYGICPYDFDAQDSSAGSTSSNINVSSTPIPVTTASPTSDSDRLGEAPHVESSHFSPFTAIVCAVSAILIIACIAYVFICQSCKFRKK